MTIMHMSRSSGEFQSRVERPLNEVEKRKPKALRKQPKASPKFWRVDGITRSAVDTISAGLFFNRKPNS